MKQEGCRRPPTNTRRRLAGHRHAPLAMAMHRHRIRIDQSIIIMA
jgi:hypothetical protein